MRGRIFFCAKIDIEMRYSSALRVSEKPGVEGFEGSIDRARAAACVASGELTVLRLLFLFLSLSSGISRGLARQSEDA